jgi:hypothetical protein
MNIIQDLKKIKKENRQIYNDLRLEIIDKLMCELSSEEYNSYDELSGKIPKLFNKKYLCDEYSYDRYSCHQNNITMDVKSEDGQLSFFIDGQPGADGYDNNGIYSIDISVLFPIEHTWNFTYDYCVNLSEYTTDFDSDMKELHTFFTVNKIAKMSLKKFTKEVGNFITELFNLRLDIDTYDREKWAHVQRMRKYHSRYTDSEDEEKYISKHTINSEDDEYNDEK